MLHFVIDFDKVIMFLPHTLSIFYGSSFFFYNFGTKSTQKSKVGKLKMFRFQKVLKFQFCWFKISMRTRKKYLINCNTKRVAVRWCSQKPWAVEHNLTSSAPFVLCSAALPMLFWRISWLSPVSVGIWSVNYKVIINNTLVD